MNVEWATLDETPVKLEGPGKLEDARDSVNYYPALAIGAVAVLEGEAVEWINFAAEIEQEAAKFLSPGDLFSLGDHSEGMVTEDQEAKLRALHARASVTERAVSSFSPIARIAAPIRQHSLRMFERPALYREATAAELLVVGARVLDVLDVFSLGRGFESGRGERSRGGGR